MGHEVAQQETRRIHIPIREVACKGGMSIDHMINRHISKQFEGYCDNYGYITPGSVELIGHQIGTLVSVDSKSMVEYKVTYSFSSINPCPGDEYQVVIGSITKAGIIGYMKDHTSVETSPLLFMVPNKDICLDGRDIQSFADGDTIKVSLLKSRVKFRGRQIQVVGKLV